jgi:hypothetical protein
VVRWPARVQPCGGVARRWHSPVADCQGQLARGPAASSPIARRRSPARAAQWRRALTRARSQHRPRRMPTRQHRARGPEERPAASSRATRRRGPAASPRRCRPVWAWPPRVVWRLPGRARGARRWWRGAAGSSLMRRYAVGRARLPAQPCEFF